jgi:hypothetical protein
MFYAVLFMALAPFVASTTVLAGIDRAHVLEALAALEWPKLLVVLTTPAWWLTAPMFAGQGSAYLVSLIPLALAVILQRELVLRSKARFEESALEQAKLEDSKTSPTRAAVKRVAWTRGHHPFALPSAGYPELAVIWKNTIRISRLPWTWSVGAGAAVLVGVALIPAVLGLPDWTFGVPVGIGVSIFIFQPILGGMSWNNDLRSELMHLELVRTWPVAAPRFLLAEVVSPALLSFASAMFGAGMALASLFGNRLRHVLTGQATELHLLPRSGELLGVPNMGAAVLLFLACLPIAAAASFVSSAVQNVGVLLMPAWMAHSVDRSRGVAAFGQRLVTTFALGLTFLLALLPSALLIGLALLIQHLLGVPWSAWELPFWGILGAIPPFFLGWLLLRFAAPLWERLDASAELLEIGR